MGLLIRYFPGKWDPGVLPLFLSSLKASGRSRHQTEDCAPLRLSQGLCLGESVALCIGAPSLSDAPSP